MEFGRHFLWLKALFDQSVLQVTKILQKNPLENFIRLMGRTNLEEQVIDAWLK